MPSRSTVDRVKLIALRNAKGWSVKRLCREADVEYSSYWRIEKGRSLNPRIETIQKVAGALGVAVEELMVADGQGAAQPPPAVAIEEAPVRDALVVSAAQIEEIVARAIERAADTVTERVVERLHEVLGADQSEEVATVLQRAGIGDPATLDDRIPVMFSGVIWEELTEEEKRGVISLVKRLMGRPHGRMGKRGSR